MTLGARVQVAGFYFLLEVLQRLYDPLRRDKIEFVACAGECTLSIGRALARHDAAETGHKLFVMFKFLFTQFRFTFSFLGEPVRRSGKHNCTRTCYQRGNDFSSHRLQAQNGSFGPPGPPIPGIPFMPPIFFIIFIRPPPFIFFIMVCICSNSLSMRLTS